MPAVIVGWQITSAELSYIKFHDDLRDIAAQPGANIGLNTPKTDDQIRDEVVTTAAEYGIYLHPDQVKLRRIANGKSVRFDLAVDYTTRVNLLLCSFNLHFNETSAKS